MARTKGALGKKTLTKLAIDQNKPVENPTAKNPTGEIDTVMPVKKGRGRPKGVKNKNPLMLDQTVVKKERVKQIYESNIPKKEKLGQLTGKFVNNFIGKDYKDALDQAEAWAKVKGYTLLDYYEQVAFGTSIIVSYNKE